MLSKRMARIAGVLLTVALAAVVFATVASSATPTITIWTDQNRKADVTQIAHVRALPSAVLEPVFADLIVDGYAEGSLHDLGLTPTGHAAIAGLRVKLRDWVLEHLDNPDPDPEAVSAAITRIVRRLVIERADSKDSLPSLLPTSDV